MMNYNGNDYIWLFNNNNIDLWNNTWNMIILNSEGKLILNNNVISTQYLLFSDKYLIFAWDDLNNPIETKITNNYIIDNTIDGKKISDYSIKYFKFKFLSNYVVLGSNNIGDWIETKIDDNFISEISQWKIIGLVWNLWTITTNIGILQWYFLNDKLKLTNMNNIPYWYLIINDGEIPQIKILNLVSNLWTISNNIWILQWYFDINNKLKLANMNLITYNYLSINDNEIPQIKINN